MRRTVCHYCGVGCEVGFDKNGKALHLKDGIVSKGKLCIKGVFGHEFVNHPERIKGCYVKENLLRNLSYNPESFPVWRKGFREVPYSLACEIVARKLLEIKEKYGRKAFAAIGGARTNCESAYLFQKFTREVIGSPNVDNCARICHSPSLKGLRVTVGEGAASCSFDEIYNSELIVVIGSNTTEAHPIVSHRIIEHVRNGAELAVVDVREIGLFRFASYKLLLPFDSNLLFLNAVAKYIVEKKLYDWEFIESRTEGFEKFMNWIISEGVTGREVFKKLKGYEFLYNEIPRFAEALATKKAIFLWGLGITEHTDGSRAVMAIANLALLTGNVGRKGTGLIPLRGQNNVQGACDMGMLPYFLPGYREPEEEGLMTPQVFDAILEGKIKALWVMGEDIAHVHPNLNKIQKALENLELLVVNELFPCETVKYADVVFGVKSCYEKAGVYINAERKLHLSEPVFDSELPDDWEIIRDVARAMGVNLDLSSSEDVWNMVRKELPEMFGGASYSLLKEKFLNAPQWPIPPGSEGKPNLYLERFSTPSGKAKFIPTPYSPKGMVKELLENNGFLDFYLTTGRILLHYNNSAQTSHCHTLNKFKTFREDIVYASEKDKEKLQRAKRVVLYNENGETAPLPIEYNKHIKEGTLFVSFHRPESRVNFLFGDDSDEFVKTAAFKSVKVKVRKVE